MTCQICGAFDAVGMAEKRKDYVAHLASKGVTQICPPCDGKEHWRYAEGLRKEARGREAHAGAMATDSPPSLWQSESAGGD